MRLWNTFSAAWSALAGRSVVPGLRQLAGLRRFRGTFTGTTRTLTRRGSVQLEESSLPGISQDGTLELELQVPTDGTPRAQVQGSHIKGGTVTIEPAGEHQYKGTADLGSEWLASLELLVGAQTVWLRYGETARHVQLLTDQTGFDPPGTEGAPPACEETSVQVTFEATAPVRGS